ncbi:MAG TPA: formate-dependent phosphoribosylglycinamide formyltransferase [Thermoplasmata archaeon]|nr:formate-dependent phosphoribosylglycinamide formyltransferase [Thermoplasmata archaeon]
MGTPLVGDAPRVLLLGSGELGREIAIEAIRLGAEVIAVDRYANAPAMQVAHRHHVLAMTDGAGLRALVERETPDVIVPEIEQIDTATLVELESEGWTVIPRAEATRITMDRERIRRLAAERARVPTSRFLFANGLEEARRAVDELGLPCLFKSITSSSGHGMTLLRDAGGVAAAYRAAAEGGRVANPRVMIEEHIPFDLEVTMLTVRHVAPGGERATTVMDPIGHARPGTLYHESWQPAETSPEVLERLRRTATAVTDQLGGVGVFGVECFVKGSQVYFSEVSPRPHDTGLVTLGSQWNSEFALHARAILGLPYRGPEPTHPSAAHVILAPSGGWAPSFGGLQDALGTHGVRLFLFGKPEAYPERRLGVAVARGPTVADARRAAEAAAHAVESRISVSVPHSSGAAHP